MTQRFLSKLQEFFSMQPIEKAWIFGSFARGEETLESDVDILVRYTKGKTLGLFGICELIEKLEDLLGRRVDLVEEGSLYPRVAKRVESEKIQIYERSVLYVSNRKKISWDKVFEGFPRDFHFRPQAHSGLCN